MILENHNNGDDIYPKSKQSTEHGKTKLQKENSDIYINKIEHPEDKSFTLLQSGEGIGKEIENIISQNGGIGYEKDGLLKQILAEYIILYTNNKNTQTPIKDSNHIRYGTVLRYSTTEINTLITNYLLKQGLKTLKDTIISENKKENPQEKAKIIEQEKIKIKAQEETNQQKQKEKIEKQQEKESPYKALIKKITEPIILGDITKKEVALTFDDGNSFVSEILDLLKENEIHATFFITGNNIKYKATLRKRAIAEGHQICNHTVSHNYSLTPLTLEKEIEEREEMYEKYLGRDNLIRMKIEYPFFRFPGGGGGGRSKKQELLNVLKKHGYLPIGWIYTDPSLVKENKDAPVNNGNKLANGSIVLLHFNEDGLRNAKKCIEGTQGNQGKNGLNPGNPGLSGENGQQKAVTLSELMNPEIYTIPLGRKNFPKGVIWSYETNK